MNEFASAIAMLALGISLGTLVATIIMRNL